MMIKVAEDFSKYPAGRFQSDGEWSGERFRDQVLTPALRGTERVTVVLDGAEGYGSSFLEEAFGGLVRKGLFSSRDLHERLVILSRREGYMIEIWDYIDNAKPEGRA